MAKVVNISDKLEFDENPKLVIGKHEVEVNADAETLIRVMGVFAENSEMQAVNKALNFLFKPEDVEVICNLKKNGKKLSASSVMTIVDAAMSLVLGEDEGE